ncbi:MAG: cytochrome c peroxidase, partial [Saprospiraceae bacterium]
MYKALVSIFCLYLLLVTGCKPDDPNVTDPNDLSYIVYNPILSEVPHPQGFPQMEIPTDNPLTEQGIALGRKLFYDPILSADSTQSCSSCHFQHLNFGDGKPVSTGIDNIAGRRSSMTLANVGFFTHGLFWDGRVQTLEQQAVLPVTDPVELHNDWGTIETKFRTHPTYPELFRKAFGIKNKNEITKDLAVKAIAQFERTMVSANSRYDTIFRLQLPGVFPTEEELNGFYMFFDAGQTLGLPDIHCSHCHGNRELLTHNNFDNNGLDLSNDLMNFPDKGRGAVTNITQDNGRFRTPSLRNIELSAPYMHDGRFQTLE